MKVEITLNDKDGNKILVINNSSHPDILSISMLDDEEGCIEIDIEDLKLALRKICAK